MVKPFFQSTPKRCSESTNWWSVEYDTAANGTTQQYKGKMWRSWKSRVVLAQWIKSHTQLVMSWLICVHFDNIFISQFSCIPFPAQWLEHWWLKPVALGSIPGDQDFSFFPLLFSRPLLGEKISIFIIILMFNVNLVLEPKITKNNNNYDNDKKNNSELFKKVLRVTCYIKHNTHTHNSINLRSLAIPFMSKMNWCKMEYFWRIIPIALSTCICTLAILQISCTSHCWKLRVTLGMCRYNGG